MQLHLFRISEGYLLMPATQAIPDDWSTRLEGRRPDLSFSSAELKAAPYIEEQMRLNGSLVMDAQIADILFGSFSGWTARTF